MPTIDRCGWLRPTIVCYTADHNDQSLDDSVAYVMMGWTESECDRVHWLQTNCCNATDTGGIGSTATDATG
jgi:hypothetical protein